MTYPIQSGSSFRAAQIGEAGKHSLRQENLIQVRRLTVCSSIAAAAAAHHHKGSRLIYGPLAFILLDHGFPVDYKFDEFNTPYTVTTFSRLQYWLCRLQCRILLRHLATSPLGNIFWRHSRFSTKQPEPQTHGDFYVSLLKQQTRLLLHYGEHISLTQSTMP